MLRKSRPWEDKREDNNNVGDLLQESCLKIVHASKPDKNGTQPINPPESKLKGFMYYSTFNLECFLYYFICI